MANCCFFTLKAAGFGNESDKKAFCDVFEARKAGNSGENEKPWMRVESYGIDIEDNGNHVKISGICDWSVQTAMLHDGSYAQMKVPGGKFYDESSKMTCLEELSRQYGLFMEVYSEESDNGFLEHFVIENGSLKVSECKDYESYYPEESWEEFLEVYDGEAPDGVTFEMWQQAHDEGCDIILGGFEDAYDFKVFSERLAI